MEIGNKLKELRLKQGLTLEELANRCELTKGFLSQLERDLTMPGIDTLDDILEALGSSLSDFFSDDKNTKKIFSKQDYYINEKDGATINWIVPNAQKNAMEPILLELEKDGKSQIIPPHHGEEFGYIIKGSVKLVEGGKESVVHAGETFYIQGKHEHYLKNNYDEVAQLIWVITPPNF